MKIELHKQIVLDPSLQTTSKAEATKRLPQEGQPPQPSSQTFKLSPEEVKELSQALNPFFSLFNLETKLIYHQEAKHLVVQVIDKNTGELIKQIPPEELLEIAQKIHELIGIFLKTKV